MVGLIGKKIGMTQIFDEQGSLVPVTVLRVEPNVVVQRRTVESDGYSAVVLGAGSVRARLVNRPDAGQYPDGVDPRRTLVEFRNFGHECEVGDELTLELLKDATHIDVTGTSKGKGFQGVMKRHGFGGGRKTHGSKFHRENGSTGMAATPSRVIKGTKMAGRMGGERATTLNLRVVRVDADDNLILVRGAVPGRVNGTVRIRPAVKKAFVG